MQTTDIIGKYIMVPEVFNWVDHGSTRSDDGKIMRSMARSSESTDKAVKFDSLTVVINKDHPNDLGLDALQARTIVITKMDTHPISYHTAMFTADSIIFSAPPYHVFISTAMLGYKDSKLVWVTYDVSNTLIRLIPEHAREQNIGDIRVGNPSRPGDPEWHVVRDVRKKKLMGSPYYWPWFTSEEAEMVFLTDKVGQRTGQGSSA